MKNMERIMPVTVTVESCGWSQTGTHRADNQDSFLNFATNRLWAVADGVGGSDYGGAASRFIAHALMQVPKPATLDEHIRNARSKLREANSTFRNHARTMGGTAASTVVTLLLHGDRGACVWAGDSRCYLFRDGVLYQCTKDHTLRQEKIDSGELSAPEARRMVRGNIITNAVGIHDEPRLEEARFPLRPGDRFLLCSDGLLKCIAPEALSAFLEKSTARESVAELRITLDDMPQPDNITFVVIFLSSPD
jgi:serine/threonine protein phosphatase Stp1